MGVSTRLGVTSEYALGLLQAIMYGLVKVTISIRTVVVVSEKMFLVGMTQENVYPYVIKSGIQWLPWRPEGIGGPDRGGHFRCRVSRSIAVLIIATLYGPSRGS